MEGKKSCRLKKRNLLKLIVLVLPICISIYLSTYVSAAPSNEAFESPGAGINPYTINSWEVSVINTLGGLDLAAIFNVGDLSSILDGDKELRISSISINLSYVKIQSTAGHLKLDSFHIEDGNLLGSTYTLKAYSQGSYIGEVSFSTSLGAEQLVQVDADVNFYDIDELRIYNNDFNLGMNIILDDLSVELPIKTLTADTTANDIDNDMDITFTADTAFEAGITEVSFNGTVLTKDTDYVINSGTITLKPSGGNVALTTPATGNVVIKSTGYANASVLQTIHPGAVTSLEVTAQPVPGGKSGDAFVTQPVITLKDRYGNVCSKGVSANTAVTASAKAGTGSWSIGGTTSAAAVDGVVTYSDLTHTIITPGTGDITFTTGSITADSSSFTIPLKQAVTLTKDTTNNDVDHDIDITFTPDAAFEADITSVSFCGTVLIKDTDYTISSGKITLKPGGGNTVLRTPATGNLVITATTYEDSNVSQTIDAGAAASLEVTIEPVEGAKSGDAFATQPVITLKDQYGNVCSTGVSANAVVTASAKAGTGSWSIGGTTSVAAVNGVATFTDLTHTIITPGTASITFTSGSLTLDSTSIAIPVKSTKVLTADTTNNDVDHDIDITFTPDAAFEADITSVSFCGTALIKDTDYVVSSGIVTLKPSGANVVLTTPGTGNVIITATGYSDSSVSQIINAGAAISINSGDSVTKNPLVTLDLFAAGATEMIISENSNFADAGYEAFSVSKSFPLSSGDGTKNIYAKFKDAAGNESILVSDTIELDTTIPVTSINISGTNGETSIVLGETLQFSATIYPQDATNTSVTWTVENGTGTGTISGGGLFTATGTGTVTIKATANDESGNYITKIITITGPTPPVQPSDPTPPVPPTEPTGNSAAGQTQYLSVETIDTEVIATIRTTIATAIVDHRLDAAVTVESSDNLEQVAEYSTKEDRMGITIPIGSDKLAKQIDNQVVKEVNMEVLVPVDFLANEKIDTDVTIDSKLIDAVKQGKKDLTVAIVDEKGKEWYSWIFTGADLANSQSKTVTVNLSFGLGKANNDAVIKKLLMGDPDNTVEDHANGLIVNFDQVGSLPAQSKIKIYVGNFIGKDSGCGINAGNKVYPYHFNTTTGKLESLPYSSDYVIDEKGYVTLNLLHCSSYVLLPEEADDSIVTSLENQIKVTSGRKTLYSKKPEKKTTLLQVNLPKTLELVKSLTDKTSSSAVGAVKASYRSNNKSVATVNSQGKITAKRAGTAYITTTIKLYTGKSKTFKTKITVK